MVTLNNIRPFGDERNKRPCIYLSVIPTKIGITSPLPSFRRMPESSLKKLSFYWVPFFNGTTDLSGNQESVIPADAGIQSKEVVFLLGTGLRRYDGTHIAVGHFCEMPSFNGKSQTCPTEFCHPGESRNPVLAVIPAQAGIQ